MELSPRHPSQRPAPAARHERGLAAFARISADWFWETDPDGRFIDFLGDPEDAGVNLAPRVGRTRREAAVQDPENLARIDALDDIIARRQPFRDVIYRAQLDDEPAIWCAISGEPVFDDDGAYLGYRGVGRNVDALVETQIALETKTRILDAVLAAMPDAIRVLDPDGRTVTTNDQFYTLFALNKQEMEASPDPLWYSFLEMARRGEYGPGDPEELARTRYALLGNDEFEYERQLKHGPWLEARGVPVPGGSRLTIYRDITERKAAEQAMRDANAELERRVEERTAEARRAQRMEAIGTLAGGIAHDLNNALTPVVMGLDLLSAEFPDRAGTIEMMAASARHGAEMLKQLLTFARGAEGRRLAVQPSTLIEDVERIVRGTFPKSISLESRLPSTLPVVRGDPTQLHRVLLNLCVNARDAMPNGGTLSLAAEIATVDDGLARGVAGARPGAFVRLTVEDTGTGIEAADLDRIFDPFFTTKRPDHGTGLGLSTAMGIVKAHGGFMQVRSAPGCGSTFDVYLPVVGAANAQERRPGEGRRLRGRGELILVVDDEPSIRQLYRVVLTQLGFEVIVAEDGNDGLAQVERHRARLRAIITDVLMPNMDGPTFIRELGERGVTIPIATASGRIEDRQAEELDRLNVTTRLGKPFTQRKLMTLLDQLLLSGAALA
jgi:signal transduction histidine kinase